MVKDTSKVFLGKGTIKTGLFLATTAIVVVLDQVSKSWVRANLPQIELLPGFLDFIYVENYGSAFGLFANQTFLIVIVVIATILIVLLFFRYLSPSPTLSIVSISLILGGALGNLIDRLRFGYVTDFIDIHLYEIFHWFTFNIADAAITIGIITLIYSLYRSGLFSKAYEHKGKTRDEDA